MNKTTCVCFANVNDKEVTASIKDVNCQGVENFHVLLLNPRGNFQM